jgi:fatty acid synthase subunit alpha
MRQFSLDIRYFVQYVRKFNLLLPVGFGMDTYILAIYDFIIIESVKDTPKEKTIHSGGTKGQKICARCVEWMTYDNMDKDDVVRALPLFGDVNVCTSVRSVFSRRHREGHLWRHAIEAFHSGQYYLRRPFPGEYSAFASVAGVLPISLLVEVVFYRGITIQRDSANHSDYAVTTVKLSRISPSFNGEVCPTFFRWRAGV